MDNNKGVFVVHYNQLGFIKLRRDCIEIRKRAFAGWSISVEDEPRFHVHTVKTLNFSYDFVNECTGLSTILS